MRVGQQLSRHGDDVGLAVADQCVSDFRFDAADGDHRNPYAGLDARRVFCEGRFPVHEGSLGERDARRRVLVRTHVDRVGTGFDGQFGGALRVFESDSVRRAELLRVDTSPDGEIVARALLAGAQHFLEQPSAVFDGSAVVVFAVVPAGGEKLREQIAVGGVDFYGVEARAPRPFGSGAEVEGDLLEVQLRRGTDLGLFAADGGHEHCEFFPSEVASHVHRAVPLRLGGHQHVAPFLDVEPRNLAVVHELKRDFCAVRVHPLGQLPQARQVGIVRNRQLPLCVRSARVGHGADFGDDETHATAGPFFVIGDEGFPGVSVGIDDLDAHGRHGDPVPQFDTADASGRKQVVEHGKALSGSAE